MAQILITQRDTPRALTEKVNSMLADIKGSPLLVAEKVSFPRRNRRSIAAKIAAIFNVLIPGFTIDLVSANVDDLVLRLNAAFTAAYAAADAAASYSIPASIFNIATVVNPYENGTASKFKPGRSLLPAPATSFYAATAAPTTCDVLLNATGLNGGRTANMEVRSGRHVRICGGDISPAAASVATLQQSYLFPLSGSFTVEGIYFDGKLGNPCDAVGVSGNAAAYGYRLPVAMVNCHIRGVHGTFDTTHGDGFQGRSGGQAANWVVFKSTILSKYQAKIDRAFGNGDGYTAGYVKDVDLHYDDTWTPGYTEDSSTVLSYGGDTGVIGTSAVLGRCNAFYHLDTFRIFKRPADAVIQAMRPNSNQTTDGVVPTMFLKAEGAFTKVTMTHPTSKWRGAIMVASQGDAQSAPEFYNAPGDKAAGHPGPLWASGFSDFRGDPEFSRPPGFDAITSGAQLGASPLAFTQTAALVAGLDLGTVLGYLTVQDAPPNLILDTPNALGQRLKWKGGELVVNDWFDAESYHLNYDIVDRHSGNSVPKSIDFTSTGSATWNITKAPSKFTAIDPSSVDPDGSGNLAATHGSLRSLTGVGLTSTKPTLSAGAGPSGQDIIVFNRANQQFYDANPTTTVTINEFDFSAVVAFNSQNTSSSSTTYQSLCGVGGASGLSMGKISGGAGNFTHVILTTTTTTVNIPLLAPLVNGTYYALRATLNEDGVFEFFVDGVSQGTVSIGSQQSFQQRRMFGSSATVTADVNVVFAMFNTAKMYNTMATKLMAYLNSRKA